MKFLRKIRSFFRREKLDADMAEELRLHVEEQARLNLAAGMTPDEARHAAQRQFGNADVIQERVRDGRAGRWLEQFRRDLILGGRLLLKEKAFFAISVFITTLGIGGVTAQFSVINAALLRGLPFPEPDRLVRIAVRDPSWAPGRIRNLWTRDVVAWDKEQQSLTGLAGYFMGGSFIATIHDVPERFSGSHVTDGFFSLLGVKPAQGRDFTADDQRPGAPRVTIISDALWESEFDRDPRILGRTFRLNGAVTTIVGVMPAGFSFPRDQLWLPMFNEYPLGSGPGGQPYALGRLKPGVSFAQATAEFALLAQRTAHDHPDDSGGLTAVTVEPLLGAFVGRDARQLLYVVLVAVGAVLLIACVNVMNMQFARTARRTRELAVRGALGASRGRLIAQMLTESLIVAICGGAGGVLLAAWTVDAYPGLIGALPGGTALPPWMRFEIDRTVLLFTLGATTLAVLVSGLLPAFLASRVNSLDVLKEGGRGQTHPLINRLAGGLVVGQIALTGALLVASLLLVKSVRSRYELDFGYDLDSVLAGRINFEVSYRDTDALLAAQGRFLERLRHSPEVTHAALSSRRNLMTNISDRLQIEGREGEWLPASLEIVSDGYFATLGLRPLAGREFEVTDTPERSSIVVVNATFARKYFGAENPVGRRVRDDEKGSWFTIVGVVPDTLMQGPLDARTDGAGFFVPMAHHPQSYATLVVRGRGAPMQLAGAVRRELAQFDSNLAIYGLDTPRGFLRSALGQVRAVTLLFGAFGFVATVLSVTGLYGVAAFSVSQRTQEFGIRMALGAAPRAILRLVLGQGLVRFALGTALGLGLALALTRLASSMVDNFLYKTSPHDPAVYALVLALLAVTTLLACLLPAWRATKVDPVVALRAE
ncbi:MAG TPA: ABC transporter permease [Opitutaceae bacterium]|nr:ABC transporter permease [Opitutaceae bacterium]